MSVCVTETREKVRVIMYLCINGHSSAVTLVIMFIHEVSVASLCKTHILHYFINLLFYLCSIFSLAGLHGKYHISKLNIGLRMQFLPESI